MNKVYRVIWSRVKNCYVVASELAKSYSKVSVSRIGYTTVAGILACICSFGAIMPMAEAYTYSGQTQTVSELDFDAGDTIVTNNSNMTVNGNVIRPASKTVGGFTVSSIASYILQDEESYSIYGFPNGVSAEYAANFAQQVLDKASTLGQSVWDMEIDGIHVYYDNPNGAPFTPRYDANTKKWIVSADSSSWDVDYYNVSPIVIPGETVTSTANLQVTSNSQLKVQGTDGNVTLIDGTLTASGSSTISATGNMNMKSINATDSNVTATGNITTETLKATNGTLSGANITNTSGDLDATGSTVTATNKVQTAGALKAATLKAGTLTAAAASSIGGALTVAGKISGVTAGTADTDAVNVSQLNAAIAGVSGGDSSIHGIAVNITSSSNNYNNDGAIGRNSIAIGAGAHTKVDNSVAIGANASALDDYSIAIGRDAIVDTPNAESYAGVAIGYNSQGLGQYAVALGNDTKVTGIGSSAIGKQATASGNYAVAIQGSEAAGNDSVSVGYNSYAVSNYSVALGARSATSSVDTVSVGHKATDVNPLSGNEWGSSYTRRIVNVKDGTSATDVATVGQTIQLVAGDNVTIAPDTTTTNSIGQKRYKISATSSGGASYSAGDNISIENNIVSATGLVKYDNEDKDVASLEGVRGTKLTNLKAANLTQASTDAVIGNQLWSVKQDIAGFASDINRNKANITTLNQSVTDALSSVSAVSDLVDAIDSLKADASLNNLTNQGRAVIATAAADAVQAYMAEHGGSTGNTNESARPRLMALTAPVLTADPEQGITQEDLDAKADISYVDNALANKADISDVEALSTTVSNLETNLTGSINALDSRVSDTESALSAVVDTLDTKADKDSVYTKEETDTKLADKADKSDLDVKADKDASNINVDAWAEKLGTGEIAEGNTGLVNGGTVYNTIKELGNNNMVQSDGQTISIGKDDTADSVSVAKTDGTGRALRGILVDMNDPTSAANVGYVNAMADGIIQGVQHDFSRMDNKINKTGAGAAALANLHPVDTDGDTKLNIAASVGKYHGETAGALGVFYKPSDRVVMNISSTIGNNDTMFGAGVSVAVDKPIAGGMSKIQMAKKIQQLQDVVEHDHQEKNMMMQKILQMEQELKELKSQNK